MQGQRQQWRVAFINTSVSNERLHLSTEISVPRRCIDMIFTVILFIVVGKVDLDEKRHAKIGLKF